MTFWTTRGVFKNVVIRLHA